MKDIVKKKQPINLDLSSLSYPPMAIASILHRISGLLLFILLPVMLYFLHLSLQSGTSFDELQVMLTSPYLKLCLWMFSSSLAYHLIAGVRHVILDFGFGEDLSSARRSSIFVMVLALILIICLGIWIW